MPRKYLGTDVFNEAIDRMKILYAEGHRIVVSFSAGKDSTCVLNVCRIAAAETGRLPVEVVLRDEEIMFPGTYEYAERIAKEPDISFNWLVANQPIINVFDRKNPYWWVFDPQLPPEKWVRQPPAIAQYIKDLNINSMTTPARFPPPEGKGLIAVIGLRALESTGRYYGVFSSGGYMTKPNHHNVRSARPIYDWTDDDVWKAIHDNKWDYNHAYDTMYSAGIPKKRLRIAPPTMSAHGIHDLQKAAAAWPRWFSAVAARLPGVRTAVQFGLRAVLPNRKVGESWEATYQRECIDKAPAPWIRERAEKARAGMMRTHGAHSTAPFPEVEPCYTCFGTLGSWKKMTLAMYNGDPFALKASNVVDCIEPSFFRPGAGTWGGAPAF